MKKLLVVLGLLLVLSFQLPRETMVMAGEPSTNVVLIGWDGADRKNVNQLKSDGQLPNLSQLASEGAFVNMEIIGGVTSTTPGWTEEITGYEPEITGVYSNKKTEHQTIPEGYTLPERLEEYFGDENIVTGVMIGKKKQMQKTKTGGAFNNLAVNIDEYVAFDGKENQILVAALEFIENHQNEQFFLFVLFNNPDTTGHQSGRDSKQYNDKIIKNDKRTGQIIQKLKDCGVYDHTLVYITADHGFDYNGKQNTHHHAPYFFLATNDSQVMRDGERADIAPTLYDAFGIDVGILNPPLDGVSMRQPLEPAEDEGAQQLEITAIVEVEENSEELMDAIKVSIIEVLEKYGDEVEVEVKGLD